MVNRFLFAAEAEPCSVVHVLLLFAPPDGDVAKIERPGTEPTLVLEHGDSRHMDGWKVSRQHTESTHLTYQD